jgi:hypothetical protein
VTYLVVLSGVLMIGAAVVITRRRPALELRTADEPTGEEELATMSPWPGDPGAPVSKRRKRR